MILVFLLLISVHMINIAFWMLTLFKICPHHHVFASTRVCMRIHVLIFYDFSSFWVWKRVQQFWPQKKSPFSQELKKLVQFAQLS